MRQRIITARRVTTVTRDRSSQASLSGDRFSGRKSSHLMVSEIFAIIADCIDGDDLPMFSFQLPTSARRHCVNKRLDGDNSGHSDRLIE